MTSSGCSCSAFMCDLSSFYPRYTPVHDPSPLPPVLPPLQTELQAALVKASLDAVRQLDEEVADVRAMAAQRERLIQEVASQRDAAGRFASQRTVRLREAISQAEVREVEVEDLRRKRREAKAVHGEVRGLCELMAGQSGRLQGLLAAMRQCAVDLKDQAAEAEGQVVELAGQAGAKAKDLKRTERERVAAEAAQMLASSQLVSERQGRLAAAELADDASIERQRLAWAAAEAAGGVEGLKHVVAATRVAKQETQGALLEADDELCELYERSAGLDGLLGEGAQALLRCEDEMRVLSLEAAELQRRLFATHKTAPDVPRYDRSVARLKTELLQARREVEELGAVLESPKATTGRWRLLPGKNPAPAELEGRITQVGDSGGWPAGHWPSGSPGWLAVWALGEKARGRVHTQHCQHQLAAPKLPAASICPPTHHLLLPSPC